MIAGIMLALCLAASGPADGAASDLSPEARPYNARGIALIEAGAHAAGVDELERALARMPDPLAHRAGRSKVLGSMRSALNHLYETTGDPAHLRRLQRHLLLHLEALLLALGDAATEEDTAGSLLALREVEAALAAAPAAVSPPAAPAAVSPPAAPAAVSPPAAITAVSPPAAITAVSSLAAPAATSPTVVPGSESPPAQSRAAPVPAPTAAPAGDAPRSAAPLRRASGALFGAGFVALGVMTYGVVVHADSRNKLQALRATVAESGDPRSPARDAEAAELVQRGRTHRTLGIVTGAVGGAAIVSAVVLHVVARRRAHASARVRLGPTLAPGFAGLDLRLRF